MTLDGNLIENGKFHPDLRLQNIKSLVRETVDLLSNQASMRNV